MGKKPKEDNFVKISKIGVGIIGALFLICIGIIVIVVRNFQRDDYCWQVAANETGSMASKMIAVPSDAKGLIESHPGDKIALIFYKKLHCMEKNKF
jgi:uncharacterized membrane protein